jgi:hypothetical protein
LLDTLLILLCYLGQSCSNILFIKCLPTVLYKNSAVLYARIFVGKSNVTKQH